MPETLKKRYYPTLSTIVDAEDIPDILGFVKDGIVTVLGKIHYKDLQYSKSPKGDAAFYSLSVVTKKRLDFEIPGTGIYFVLNPDLGDIQAYSIQVMSVNGVVIYSETANLSGAFQVQLNATAGLYFVDVLTEHGNVRMKLVVE